MEKNHNVGFPVSFPQQTHQQPLFSFASRRFNNLNHLEQQPRSNTSQPQPPELIDVVPTLSFERNHKSFQVPGDDDTNTAQSTTPALPGLGENNTSSTDNKHLFKPAKSYSTPHLLYWLYVLRTRLAQWDKLFGDVKPTSRHDDNSIIIAPLLHHQQHTEETFALRSHDITQDQSQPKQPIEVKMSELAVAYDFLQVEYLTIYFLLVMSPPLLTNTDEDETAGKTATTPAGGRPLVIDLDYSRGDTVSIPFPWTADDQVGSSNSDEADENAIVQLKSVTDQDQAQIERYNEFLQHVVWSGYISPMACGGLIAPLSPLEITARFGHIESHMLNLMFERVFGDRGEFGDESDPSKRKELTRLSFSNPHGLTENQTKNIIKMTNPWAIRREVVKQMEIRMNLKIEIENPRSGLQDAKVRMKTTVQRWIHNRFPHRGPKGKKIYKATVYNGPTELIWAEGVTKAPDPDTSCSSLLPVYGGSLDHHVCYARDQENKTVEYRMLSEYYTKIQSQYLRLEAIFPFTSKYDGQALNSFLLASSPSSASPLTLSTFLQPHKPHSVPQARPSHQIRPMNEGFVSLSVDIHQGEPQQPSQPNQQLQEQQYLSLSNEAFSYGHQQQEQQQEQEQAILQSIELFAGGSQNFSSQPEVQQQQQNQQQQQCLSLSIIDSAAPSNLTQPLASPSSSSMMASFNPNMNLFSPQHWI